MSIRSQRVDEQRGGQAGEHTAGLYRNDVVAPLLADLAAVDDDALEQYRTLGFLPVRTVLTPRQVEESIDALIGLIESAPDGIDLQFEAWAADHLDSLHGEERMDAVRKLMSFTTLDRRLSTIAHHPGVLRTVRALIGSSEVVLLQDMALLKPPGGGREKPWHQDKAFFNIDLDAPIIGVWIALDDATFENGCMHVVPGSHREGPVPHFARRDWQICDHDVATARDVAVPLPAGGLLFFDGLIHHGTPTNRTDTRRRALQFHFVDRDAVRITEEDRLAVFGLEGRGAEC